MKYLIHALAALCLMGTAAVAQPVIKIWSQESGAGFDAFYAQTAGVLHNEQTGGNIEPVRLGAFAFRVANELGHLDLVPTSNRSPESYAALFLRHNGYQPGRFITPAEFQRRGQGIGWRLPVYGSPTVADVRSTVDYQAAIAAAVDELTLQFQTGIGAFEQRVATEFQTMGERIDSVEAIAAGAVTSAEAAQAAAVAAEEAAVAAANRALAAEEAAAATLVEAEAARIATAAAWAEAEAARLAAEAAQTEVSAMSETTLLAVTRAEEAASNAATLLESNAALIEQGGALVVAAQEASAAALAAQADVTTLAADADAARIAAETAVVDAAAAKTAAETLLANQQAVDVALAERVLPEWLANLYVSYPGLAKVLLLLLLTLSVGALLFVGHYIGTWFVSSRSKNGNGGGTPVTT